MYRLGGPVVQRKNEGRCVLYRSIHGCRVRHHVACISSVLHFILGSHWISPAICPGWELYTGTFDAQCLSYGRQDQQGRGGIHPEEQIVLGAGMHLWHDYHHDGSDRDHRPGTFCSRTHRRHTRESCTAGNSITGNYPPAGKRFCCIRCPSNWYERPAH